MWGSTVIGRSVMVLISGVHVLNKSCCFDFISGISLGWGIREEVLPKKGDKLFTNMKNFMKSKKAVIKIN